MQLSCKLALSLTHEALAINYFTSILVAAVFLSGIICLIDILFLKKRRNEYLNKPQPKLVEYSRSFFPIFLLVLVLRSFLFESFVIPSGSEKPDLLVGDYIFGNKFSYGVRLPITQTKIINMHEPKRGDIAIFTSPEKPTMTMIKRIVGVSGDHIRYVNKVLYVNGVAATQKIIGQRIDQSESGITWPVELVEENLSGIKHFIYINPKVPAQDFSIIVPAGKYFAMGDNRDNSRDSRAWGFVSEENLISKAWRIWFSWDGDRYRVRWDRIGQAIQAKA